MLYHPFWRNKKIYNFPEEVGQTTLIEYPSGGYNSEWGKHVKTVLGMRGWRARPKRKYSWQKVAAGLEITRIL